MQIPSQIKIGGIRYGIKIVSEEELPNEGGDIATHKRTIRLLKSEPSYMEACFLHEILHAINMEMPEERIEFLAQALYQVIADNPKMFKEVSGKK